MVRWQHGLILGVLLTTACFPSSPLEDLTCGSAADCREPGTTCVRGYCLVVGDVGPEAPDGPDVSAPTDLPTDVPDDTEGPDAADADAPGAADLDAADSDRPDGADDDVADSDVDAADTDVADTDAPDAADTDAGEADGGPCDVPDALGICGAGTWQPGEDGPVCIGIDEPSGADTMCNGEDDDCDGIVDDEVDFRLAPNCGECGENCDIQDGACCPLEVGSQVGGCVVILNNPEHCGGCGTVSDANRCDPDNNEACCGLACADTMTDNDHCGGCGRQCGEGTSCCDGDCVDLSVSPLHCGQCGAACNPETEVCCIDSNVAPDFPGCYSDAQCD
jgi:hypothetical protein